MKQNAALEMFEYLKEHLIPLAKDKGDKVYESDTTVQIARPENKSVWDCEKEVKQLLSKIGAYSASVKNSINCVIINYSQTAGGLYRFLCCGQSHVRVHRGTFVQHFYKKRKAHKRILL